MKQEWLDAARKIVAEKQYGVVMLDNGRHIGSDRRLTRRSKYRGKVTLLDLFSASALVAVHDALKPENQEKLLSLDVVKACQVAFKCVK